MSATPQKKELSAIKSANQTVETWKSIRSDESFDAFYGNVLEKKKAFNRNIGDPVLKQKIQAPASPYITHGAGFNG